MPGIEKARHFSLQDFTYQTLFICITHKAQGEVKSQKARHLIKYKRRQMSRSRIITEKYCSVTDESNGAGKPPLLLICNSEKEV
ncbi:MAG: hypothetical protein WBI55_09705 [Eubacteriales bacterium]|jgi:hypothetical protein